MMQGEHLNALSLSRRDQTETSPRRGDDGTRTPDAVSAYVAPLLGVLGAILICRSSGVRDALFACGALLLVAGHLLFVFTRERTLARLAAEARHEGLDPTAAAERARRELARMIELANGKRFETERAYRRLPPPYLA